MLAAGPVLIVPGIGHALLLLGDVIENGDGVGAGGVLVADRPPLAPVAAAGGGPIGYDYAVRLVGFATDYIVNAGCNSGDLVGATLGLHFLGVPFDVSHLSPLCCILLYFGHSIAYCGTFVNSKRVSILTFSSQFARLGRSSTSFI